jgi:hypothetical protein
MSSVEDLRKALKEKAVSEKEICTTYGIPLGHKKVLLDHPRWIKIGDVLDLFSVFQKDNVIISREELRTILKYVKTQELKDFIDSLLKVHGM